MNPTKKFSELGFFATHFNVLEENLTWGIKQEIKNNDSSFAPCLLIKNTNLCIDILEGEIKSGMDFSPKFKRILHEASFTEEKIITLETIAKIENDKTVIIEVSEEELELIYRYRRYDESLNNKFIL